MNKLLLLCFLSLPLFAAKGGKPIVLTVTTKTLPSAIQNISYSVPLTASGGKAPYTWTASGTPTGIAVSGSNLAGTPTVTGTFAVRLTVKDNLAKTASLTVNLLVNPPKPPPTTSSDEEFVGPFPSWINLKAVYGAKGDGITDDTIVINKALSEVGRNGRNHNLFVNCGTYLVTGLTVPPVEGINILGTDPACVIFKLAPGAAGPLLRVNGVDYSRFSRLTFDGGGNNGAVLVEQSSSSGAFFDTGNEYADDVFKNAGVGFRCGALFNGCSEVTILRDNFSNIYGACVFVMNYNALDVWVRYSVFDHCGTGVANWDGTNVGAGNFHIYNSIFRSSTITDIGIANTTPFSFRDNFFSNSPRAIYEVGTGNPAPQTISGNTFINNPIPLDLGNHGPVLIFDNKIRPAMSTTTAVSIATNMFAVGNTIGTGPTAFAAGDPMLELDTSSVDPTTISTTEPTLPGVQPNPSRTIFEIPVGASAATIQTAINSAAALAGSRPIVHIPEGSYSIATSLSIPASCDLQLVGDGFFGTMLNWTAMGGGPVVLVTGPSHATLRDFKINANLQADGIGTATIDQAGSHVFLHGVQMGADGLASTSNLFFDALDYAVVEAEDTTHSATTGIGVKVVGGTLAAAGTPATGRLNLYSGTAASETTPYSVTSGGTLLLRDLWNESGGPAFLAVSGRALVTLDGAWANLNGNVNQMTPAISVSNLVGKVSVLSSVHQDRVVISGNNTAGSVLESVSLAACPVVSPYFVNNGSPAGTVGLFTNRECTTMPGTGSIVTADTGSADQTFLRAMLADTRAAKQAPLATLSNSVTDLRIYRVWTNRGINGIHLQ